MFKFYFNFSLHINRTGKARNVSPNSRKKAISFTGYAEKEILHKKNSHSYSTSQNYRTALNSFLKFLDGEDVPLHKIDSVLIGDYQKWLENHNVCLNSISCYMRSLRAIYNRAIGGKKAIREHPFKKVFTGIEKTQKRSINKEDIRRLQSLNLKAGTYMCLVRDIFLLSFYACGIPFVDIAYMKKNQISDGYLTYTRHKTKQKVRISLEPCMTAILNKYMSEDREHIFPIIDSTDSETAYRQYRNGICRYNKSLKLLGKKCGKTCNLSSYVARHTWASLAYHSNVDIPVISKALGHISPRTTVIYVKEINDRSFESANRKFLDKILGGLHTSI